MMAMLPVMGLPATTALHASDLSIYKPNTVGKTSILLMLDTSGSMGISSLVLPKNNIYGSPGDVDQSLCARVSVKENNNLGNPSTNFWQWKYNLVDTRADSPTFNKTAIQKKVTIGTEEIIYYVRGCAQIINGKKVEEYDRLSRLKDAIIPLLADRSSKGLSDETVMGVGHFSSKTDLNVSTATNKLVDGHSGRILVPNAPLSLQQRIKIAKQIAEFKSLDVVTNEDGTDNPDLKSSSRNYPDVLKASSGTPTAHAYAEAGAYMMGTNTGWNSAHAPLTRVNYLYDGYMVMQNGSEQVHFICVALGSTLTSALGGSNNVKQCVNNWPSHSGKSVSDTTINNGVYKPNADGTWSKVTKTQLNVESGNMDNGWDTFKKLPVGWRYGGWMKVDNEPMDVEAIVATVWTGYAGGTNGLVSYRTNPFALIEGSQPTSYTDNMVGGMRYSVSSSILNQNYIAGGSTSSCDGNGIYFLTDGAPNSTKDEMARTIMNLSLRDEANYKFVSKPTTNHLVSPALKSGLFSGETGGWEYIGEYAKKLRNRITPSDRQKNPLDMNIKTAVVGFGSSFAGIPKNSDGTYNCEAVKATNLDAYNACKWGGGEYGGGGFYYAENSEDIVSSILEFVDTVSVPFTATSLGSISVPRDPLDQTQIMTEGFFPMISPFDDSQAASNQKKLMWIGNLKKYKIIDGTLKDTSGNAIYTQTGNEQKINSTAQDLWSFALSNDDHSNIKSGGTWNKIPVPSTSINPADPSNAASTRNVFTMDGSSLKKITKTNLATNYTGTGALSATGITIAQRYALLNYLGHNVGLPATLPTTLTTTAINQIAAETPQIPYRFLGGVVHSTPIVATKEAKIDATTNSIGKRTEYVVYGSMEGGLHIADAETGKELSVFVPKEILTNQYQTLIGENVVGAGLQYGVDAPWAVDNQFKIKNTTTGSNTTTTYESSVLNIYGGLRMGGNAIYGLNIENPASPNLLFHKTPFDSDFTEMRQIWSKPTIAEIRLKGERKRVLIFGGGYDASAYETANANPTSSAGNALYVVNASDGTLIWKTTGTGTNSKILTVNSNVKHSVVAQPVVRDYDSDGLADMIYFADLGGQIFRVDLNNLAQMSTSVNTNIAVRVQRIAALAKGTYTPRFYDRLTTAVFGQGSERFVLVTAGSGNRSFPLESSPEPEKIYGILDYDAAKNGIEKASYTGTFSAEATQDNLYNRGDLGKANTTINGLKTVDSKYVDEAAAQMGSAGSYRGWYFNLKSKGDSGTAYHAKSFEESQLVQGDLYINLYDPQASLGTVSQNCGGGVQGLSTIHRVCAPFGSCAAYVTTDYQGIIGPTLGGLTNPARTTQLIGPLKPAGEKCIGKCDTDKTTLSDQQLKKYSQARRIRPTRWFEW